MNNINRIVMMVENIFRNWWWNPQNCLKNDLIYMILSQWVMTLRYLCRFSIHIRSNLGGHNHNGIQLCFVGSSLFDADITNFKLLYAFNRNISLFESCTSLQSSSHSTLWDTCDFVLARFGGQVVLFISHSLLHFLGTSKKSVLYMNL